MQQTTNYNLNVIEQSDKILDSVTALGQNATSIDTILAGKIDKTSIATSISSSSTNDEVAGAKAVYDFAMRNIIQASIPTDYLISTTHVYETLPVATNILIGDKLSLNSNYKIVIGADVSVVRVYANANWVASYANENKYLQIVKNDTTSIVIGRKYMTTSNQEEIQLEYLINVVEGDTIEVQVYGTQNDKIARSRGWIIVEALEYGTTSASTLNLLNAPLMNTGSLVGMGDRAELTSIASELTDTNVGEKEVTIIKDKAEGSGDAR